MRECYTLGIILTKSLDEVLLIKKEKPNWQKGKLNFIGGKVEQNESYTSCIVRECEEETGLMTNNHSWLYIGKLYNENYYEVSIHLLIHDPALHGNAYSREGLGVDWYDCDNLPDNVLSNIKLLVEHARVIVRQGNIDKLVQAVFIYEGSDES